VFNMFNIKQINKMSYYYILIDLKFSIIFLNDLRIIEQTQGNQRTLCKGV